jgi:hypothetical protein
MNRSEYFKEVIVFYVLVLLTGFTQKANFKNIP